MRHESKTILPNRTPSPNFFSRETPPLAITKALPRRNQQHPTKKGKSDIDVRNILVTVKCHTILHSDEGYLLSMMIHKDGASKPAALHCLVTQGIILKVHVYESTLLPH